ncbi:MAG: cytidylate kinase-like family protein [Acidobacteria bacterium]|nr:cytidylate kinase-like family protein [Acidobacteriota bacterium]
MATKHTVSTHPAEARMLLDDLTRRLEAEADTATRGRPALGPYVTISRLSGSGGSSIARALAKEMGWEVLDRELVEGLARELELDPRRLELMDETRTNWLRDTIFNLLDSRLVLQDSYVTLLGRVMALAAHKGRVIFVGRAGNLVLPRDDGLRVRIVAPRPWRVRHTADREGLGEAAASERVASLDAARADFVRRHFRVDADDPSAFDLVLDAAALGSEGVVTLIKTAMEIKGLIGSGEAGIDTGN